MNKLALRVIVVALVSLWVVVSEAASTSVCQNIKLMIVKQQRTLKHYKEIHANSRIDIKKSKNNIINYKHSVKESQKKVDRLRKQLSVEQSKLDKMQRMLSIEKQRVARSNKNLKMVTLRVIDDEQELINSLVEQYQQMCVIGSAQSSNNDLTSRYYP